MDEKHWRVCAQKIEEMGAAVLDGIRRFMQVLQTDAEMNTMRMELRQAIDGGLRRVEIETVVAEVLNEHGRNDLSPGKFCDRFSSEWTGTLNIMSSKNDLLLDIRKLIEITLSQIPEPPPITAKEIMNALQVPAGPLVGELVRERDRLIKTGIKDRFELLKCLSDHLKTKSPATT